MLYKYILLKSGWGIAIDIDFDIINKSEENTIRVNDNVSLMINEKNLDER